MTKEDILHLAQLSRIELSDAELASLGNDIPAILEYVSTVTDIAGDTEGEQLTPVYNVFRADEVTNEPGSYSEAILNEAPQRERHHFLVKKILSTDE